ncbi:MAG TPA: hypothetical protein VGV14_05610 [Rhodanobacter sp.]|nr:hypothetical protein [Rhodanobacter sp.]
MATEANKQGSARQAVLDDFTTSLQGQSKMPPAARHETAQLFEQALQDAAGQCRTPEEVLDDWTRTTDEWSARLEAMQKRDEISATDVADIIRQFDDVTHNLRAIQQRSQAHTDTDERTVPLPQGMPSDVARAFEQQLRKP